MEIAFALRIAKKNGAKKKRIHNEKISKQNRMIGTSTKTSKHKRDNSVTKEHTDHIQNSVQSGKRRTRKR